MTFAAAARVVATIMPPARFGEERIDCNILPLGGLPHCAVLGAFGIVVAGSVLISAVVSLTLTPMMSARWLKHKENQSRFFEVTERFFTNLN